MYAVQSILTGRFLTPFGDEARYTNEPVWLSYAKCEEIISTYVTNSLYLKIVDKTDFAY